MLGAPPFSLNVKLAVLYGDEVNGVAEFADFSLLVDRDVVVPLRGNQTRQVTVVLPPRGSTTVSWSEKHIVPTESTYVLTGR